MGQYIQGDPVGTPDETIFLKHWHIMDACQHGRPWGAAACLAEEPQVLRSRRDLQRPEGPILAAYPGSDAVCWGMIQLANWVPRV